MRPSLLLTTCAFSLLVASQPVPGFADSFQKTGAADAASIIQDTGVANRLVVGELLRTLSQEIPAAACHLHNQINSADAEDVLTDGIAQVDELIAALAYGDIFWGITTAEARRKTIAEIANLRAQWAPVLASGRTVLADPSDRAATSLLIGMSDSLYDTTDRLLSTLDGQYSNSAEILRRDVMAIQIAGRMAALNQRIALGACSLTANGQDPELAADLAQTKTIYENSLMALSDGMPAIGLLPPPTPGISEKLAEIKSIWSENEILIARVVAGQDISQEERFDLYYGLIDERVLILDALYLYQDHSKVH